MRGRSEGAVAHEECAWQVLPAACCCTCPARTNGASSVCAGLTADELALRKLKLLERMTPIIFTVERTSIADEHSMRVQLYVPRDDNAAARVTYIGINPMMSVRPCILTFAAFAWPPR